ncbi:hypothetical protein CKAH01_16494 [Colletotrichum kahawae]|uniref:Uncharacterized protein n=1 Tax=Colletotrichum kahawae TaxID=34407 RepID=A0AAD9YFQ7_COLKA|nr:hypothetical protein CKAH01_16494 [Colletotrichum kahawae]
MPYSYYRSSGRRCKLLPRGEVYSECTHLGKSCDTVADVIYTYKFLIPVGAVYLANCQGDSVATSE